MGTFDLSERGGRTVNIEALINELADPGAAPDEQAIRDFTEACRRVDEDPREKQRYRDIVDLIEAEDALYDQGVAALDRGDYDAALPLLRLAAQKGIGNTAWLLAVALDKRGETAEAITWYERAASDGDSRADAALGARQARSAVVVGSARAPWDLADHINLAVLTEEAFRPGAQPRKGSLIAYTHTRRPEDCDFDFAWLPDATLRELDEGVYLGQCKSWLGTDISLPVPLRVRLLGRGRAVMWQQDLAISDSVPTVERLIFRVAYNCGPPGIDVHPVLSHSGQARWLPRDRGVTASFDRAAAVLALIDRCEYGTARRAAVPWPGRRPTSGRTAGDVMIPYVAVPVLALSATVDVALEEMLRSGEPALPVGEGPAVAGVVTLADLARSVRDSRGIPSIQRIETLRQLLR